MRLRSTAVVLAVAAACMVSAAPTAAHDEHPPGSSPQIDDFAGVAERAADISNAPKGFAPCVDGKAGGVYPCENVDMLSNLSRADLGASFVNDMWGWTDPETGKDYALVGATEGTVIVDVSDPRRPDVVGTLPAHTLDERRPFWRDIKVFDDHMFVVSEQRGHGLQVFDLTQLRGVTGDPVTFTETAHYAGFSTAHNIAVNAETGFLYAVGTDTCNGGLHMIDVNNDPAAPSFAGCFAEHGYIHDTQCVVYRGPDADYAGREVCFNSNAVFRGPTLRDIDNHVSIVDVTDKGAPEPIARPDYLNDGYSHQGWLTPDHAYFLHGDELDEYLGATATTTTRVWDMQDLDNPTMTLAWANDTTSIDHNLYTEGKVAFASNYTSGLRVYSTRDIGVPDLSELAFFDMYPENDNATFEGGTWSNYPYFRQQTVVGVSSMDRGLFLLQPRISTASGG